MTTTITGATGVNQITDDAITDAKLPAGSVLQVVQSVQTNYQSFSLNNTWADVSGLTVALTPSSTSNKVLVSFNLMIGTGGAGPYPRVKLLKNGADLIVGNSGIGSRVSVTGAFGAMPSSTHAQTVAFEYLDSPSTTSETTYKLQVSGYASRVFYTNITGGSDSNSGMTCVSTITLMEIAG